MLSFELNSAEMTAGAKDRAKVFAQALNTPELRNSRFLIEGHTDSVGGRAANRELSQRRAQSVADFLVAQGVDRSRLEVQGFGYDQPLPGKPASADENRRVEAALIS
ncbi:OmpA family protein [Sphingomonas gilva]|uniref:OmpA family protein n=2 Tax=Sphingomonas gilva TaxID=2305907 RepID=A0A396RN08_9SPHN|nr:OmpA family protein [Sphingomonas gilva]